MNECGYSRYGRWRTQRMGARWRENAPTVAFPQAEHQRDLCKATSGWEFQNKTMTVYGARVFLDFIKKSIR